MHTTAPHQMESLANVNTHPGVDGILKQFEVNALGPLRVTAALSGNLQPGSRVVMISSRMGSVGKYGWAATRNCRLFILIVGLVCLEQLGCNVYFV